jgi:AraC-like DNA-binding protein
MRFAFTTDTVEPAGRFEAFRDALARGMFHFDLESRARAPYRGVVDLDVGGPVQFGKVIGSAAAFHRTAAMADRCAAGAWVLLTRAGTMRLHQDGTALDISPGAGAVIDPVRAHAGDCLAGSDTFVVQVPDALLRTSRRDVPAARATLLPAGGAMAAMMFSVLETHHRLPGEARDATAAATGLYLADLVRLALAGEDARDRAADSRGVRAARLQMVLDDIARHYLDAGLRADHVACRLGVSPRYVHRLLEPTGRSFSEHVLDRRLALARRLLVEPGRTPLTVADVAYGCGFGDLSYFNRNYRRRFGETPSRTRESGRVLHTPP